MSSAHETIHNGGNWELGRLMALPEPHVQFGILNPVPLTREQSRTRKRISRLAGHRRAARDRQRFPRRWVRGIP